MNWVIQQESYIPHVAPAMDDADDEDQPLARAFLLGIVMLLPGMRAMMETGANAETAPTLWLGVPILNVLTIAILRQGHGAHVHLGAHTTAIDNPGFMALLLSIQLAFLLLGWLRVDDRDTEGD